MNTAIKSSESKDGFCPNTDWTCTPLNIARTCGSFDSEGGSCSGLNAYPNATISDYGSISGNSAMQNEIYHCGPIACGVDAMPLLNWESGIISTHVISIVGSRPTRPKRNPLVKSLVLCGVDGCCFISVQVPTSFCCCELQPVVLRDEKRQSVFFLMLPRECFVLYCKTVEHRSRKSRDLLQTCENGKPRKTGACALCTVDDTCCFLTIRLGPKTSVYHKKVIVVSTASGCDVTNCATTLQGFNEHASSRREAVSDSRGVPRCTERNFTNLRLLTCVDHSTRPVHHTRIQ